MTTLAEVVSVVSASIGLVRELNSVDRQVDEATYKLTIAELTTKLADAQLGLTEIRDTLAAKDAEIVRLQAALATKEELIKVRGDFYRSIDGEPVGYPMCPLCIDKVGLFVETQQSSDRRQSTCPNCKSLFNRKTRYNYPEEKTVS